MKLIAAGTPRGYLKFMDHLNGDQTYLSALRVSAVETNEDGCTVVVEGVEYATATPIDEVMDAIEKTVLEVYPPRTRGPDHRKRPQQGRTRLRGNTNYSTADKRRYPNGKD